jgi:uncharacterized repeat protein (TIGR03803 family)
MKNTGQVTRQFSGGIGIVALALLAVGLVQSVQASTYKVIHEFNGSNGRYPAGRLIFDAAGNLYGVTSKGGTFGLGNVFKLSPTATGGWRSTPLHNFASGTPGNQPSSGLVSDAAGNLYGVTFAGGYMPGCQSNGCGVVYKLSPLSTGGWKYTKLYAFRGGADGANPAAELILDSAGNLYGTAEFGGIFASVCPSGCGVVFKLSPSSSGTWSESILYSFTGGSDGALPQANVVFDSAGNLYSTAASGGNTTTCSMGKIGCGVVFKLSPNSSGPWTESILYSFSGTDGVVSEGGVTFDASGSLYGGTYYGGILSECNNVGCGVIYKLSPTVSGPWRETVLNIFQDNPRNPVNGGPGGANATANLSFDPDGNIYSTAFTGGSARNDGVVFKLSPTSNGGLQETVLHTFNGGDGSNPFKGVVLDSAGKAFGTTPFGGNSSCGCGVVFEVQP